MVAPIAVAYASYWWYGAFEEAPASMPMKVYELYRNGSVVLRAEATYDPRPGPLSYGYPYGFEGANGSFGVTPSSAYLPVRDRTNPIWIFDGAAYTPGNFRLVFFDELPVGDYDAFGGPSLYYSHPVTEAPGYFTMDFNGVIYEADGFEDYHIDFYTPSPSNVYESDMIVVYPIGPSSPIAPPPFWKSFVGTREIP